MSVKVAVFGCLHGMLNEMYEQVAIWEKKNGKVDFIIVCGDCQTIRHADDLKCLNVPKKYTKLGDFHEYYSGQKKIPKTTIFVGGNHEASNYLMTLPYGGWICDNFYYMGYSGAIRYKGFRIAGVSGIYNYWNYRKGRFECMPLDENSIRSIYHTRRLDVFRLELLQNNIEKDPLDIMISHDWPCRIYDHGNREQLLRFKPGFRKDVESKYGLGNQLTKPLIGELKPKRWFAAHLHCRFYAKVKHDQNKQTEFLSLNKIGNGKQYMEVLDLTSSRPDEIQDDELYYDEEWLTILRKTMNLEETSANNVFCPATDSDTSLPYYPSERDIKETIDIMNKSKDGFVIPRNFTMVEPVIYNRPEQGPISIDRNREQFFPNPQTELLCKKLGLNELRNLKQSQNSKANTSSDIFDTSVSGQNPNLIAPEIQVRYSFSDEDFKAANEAAARIEDGPRLKKVAVDPELAQGDFHNNHNDDDDDSCLEFCIDTKGEP